MNKINAFEINKYIIAKFGVDALPLFRDRDLLEGVISGYTKKKAAAVLSDIELRHGHTKETMEHAVANTIHKYYELSSRGKRFAIILLLMAKSKDMISSSMYKKLREMWGYSEYTPDIEEALKEPEVHEDDFNKLT